MCIKSLFEKGIKCKSHYSLAENNSSRFSISRSQSDKTSTTCISVYSHPLYLRISSSSKLHQVVSFLSLLFFPMTSSVSVAPEVSVSLSFLLQSHADTIFSSGATQARPSLVRALKSQNLIFALNVECCL